MSTVSTLTFVNLWKVPFVNWKCQKSANLPKLGMNYNEPKHHMSELTQSKSVNCINQNCRSIGQQNCYINLVGSFTLHLKIKGGGLKMFSSILSSAKFPTNWAIIGGKTFFGREQGYIKSNYLCMNWLEELRKQNLFVCYNDSKGTLERCSHATFQASPCASYVFCNDVMNQSWEQRSC